MKSHAAVSSLGPAGSQKFRAEHFQNLPPKFLETAPQRPVELTTGRHVDGRRRARGRPFCSAILLASRQQSHLTSSRARPMHIYMLLDEKIYILITYFETAVSSGCCIRQLIGEAGRGGGYSSSSPPPPSWVPCRPPTQGNIIRRL